MPTRISADFDPSTRSVRAARAFVEQNVAALVPQPADVGLLVSELATNAVLHAQTPFTIAVEVCQVVHVAVADGSQALPSTRDAAPTEASGRGLKIVDALADQWGVEPTDRGKVVWFEVVAAADLPTQP